MRYVFKPDATGTKGTMYEMLGNKKKKIGRVDINNPKTKQSYKVAVCCQLVAEGEILEEICKQSWSPELVEFYKLIDDNVEWAEWYSKSVAIRSKTLVDRVANLLKDEKLNPEQISVLEKVLAMNKKLAEDNGGVKSATYVQGIWQPENFKPKGWGYGEEE